MIVFGAPDGVLHKLVQQRGGAGEEAVALQVRIDGNSVEILRPEVDLRLHQYILKPKNGKGGFIVVLILLAGVDHLL